MVVCITCFSPVYFSFPIIPICSISIFFLFVSIIILLQPQGLIFPYLSRGRVSEQLPGSLLRQGLPYFLDPESHLLTKQTPALHRLVFNAKGLPFRQGMERQSCASDLDRK